MRDAELGGASFTGATLKSLKLHGIRFSEPSVVGYLLKEPCFEMETASWAAAAAVYAAIGKRASEDWDFTSADRSAYLAMTCIHRRRIEAGPLVNRNTWSACVR